MFISEMLSTEKLFFLFFLILVNLILIFFYKKIAKLLNIYDIPGHRKIHLKPTPLIGGVFLITNFIIFLIFFINDNNLTNSTFYIENIKNLIIFFLTVFLFFLLGFIDDKINLSPISRILAFCVFLFVVIKNDQSLLINKIEFQHLNLSITLSNLSMIFSIFCILSFVIVSNMNDGINLQSIIFNLFIHINFLYIWYSNYDELNLFVLTVIISLLFLSILNYPGKIFLGDSGVYCISFITAYLFIKFSKLNVISHDEILLIVFIPFLDCLKVMLFRVINSKNPLYPDQTHLHHLLLRGLDYKKTLSSIIFLYFLPFIFNFFGIFLEGLIALFVIYILIIYTYEVR